MIRWSQGDYIRLGKAVSEFNKQVSQNSAQEKNLYLPNLINYKELRDSIQTREGLNSYIQQLKRINLSGAMDLEKIENGMLISKYTKRELERAKSQQIPQLEQQIAKIEKETLKDYGITKNIALPEGFKTGKQKQLEAKLRDFKDLYSLSGKKFKKRAKQLMVNQVEKKYRQAYIFRKNYMHVMRREYGNYRDYWIFMKYYANKHKNPVSFYDDLPEDSTYYPDDLYRQSKGEFTEADFTAFVEELIGMSIDEVYEIEGIKKGKSAEDLKLEKTEEAKSKTVKKVNKMFTNLK